MDKIKPVLREAGFTDKEASVYITLLSCGRASAYTIAEKSGLKPPTVYLTLQNLMHKGLAQIIPKAKKKLFVARDPQEVITLLEEKVSRTRSALPEMLALIPSGIPKINIKYYQGITGIAEAMDYGFKHDSKSKEVVGFFSTAENTSEQYLKISEKYINALKRHNIHMRGITPEHQTTKGILNKNVSIGHEVRVIPYDEYSAKASIEASDVFVRIVLNAEQKAIVIEDAELAKMVKQVFEMVWKKN